MSATPEFDLDDQRLALLKAKSGQLFNWTTPNLTETIGPYDPSCFELFDQQRRTLLDRFAQQLRDYPNATIQIIAGRQKEDPDELRSQWKDFCRLDLDRLVQNKPPWFAGGFGHPDHVADFQYWCKMPRFSTEELLCLSIGVGPKEFDANQISDLKRKSKRTRLWPTLVFLIDRHEQLTRAFGPGYSDPHIRPVEFLNWAEKMDFESHPEFIRILQNYHIHSSKGRPAQRESGRVDEREINSVSMLLTAIAIFEYGYVPGSKRSPIPREIADVAASVGVMISDDTVRKYLKRGAELIPKDDLSE